MKRFLAQTAMLALLLTPGAFIGSYYGAQALHVASAQTAPCGNGTCSGGGGSGTVTSATAADTTLTQTGVSTVNPSFALNTANANTWSAAQSFSAANNVFSNAQGAQFSGAGAICPGAGTPIGTNTTVGSEFGPLCLGPQTGVNALVIGKTCAANAWGGVNVCNSGAADWCAGLAGGDRCFYIVYTGSTVTFNVSAGTPNFQFAGSVDLSVNPLLRASYITQGATNNFGGSCTAAANTCTVTLGHGFTTAICYGNDQTAAAPVKATASGTTLTLVNASPGGATDVLNGVCFGNPS